MATGQGTVVFDFGTAPGTNIATTTGVTATGMSSTSNVEIYLQGTSTTATHNAYEHSIVELGGLTMKAISKTANSFNAQAATSLRLTGTISASFVWSD
jgi:hypothetical protein